LAAAVAVADKAASKAPLTGYSRPPAGRLSPAVGPATRRLGCTAACRFSPVSQGGCMAGAALASAHFAREPTRQPRSGPRLRWLNSRPARRSFPRRSQSQSLSLEGLAWAPMLLSGFRQNHPRWGEEAAARVAVSLEAAGRCRRAPRARRLWPAQRSQPAATRPRRRCPCFPLAGIAGRRVAWTWLGPRTC